MTATDRHSMGRNFAGHYARRDWNVLPVTSVIEVQYAMAPGTALVQKRFGGDGITIVTGGDAGHGGGRLRHLPGLEHAAGQRAAGADHRDEQRLGNLHPGEQPARRDAHHRPRQGVRHSGRGRGRQRPGGELARHPPGDGLLPPGAPPVHAGGDGVAAARPFVVERRRPASRTSRTRWRCSSRSCSTPASSTRPRPSRSTTTPTPRRRRRWSRRCREPSRRRTTCTRHTYAPSTVDAVYPEDYTGLP